jgi:hypothetical protein
VGIGTAAVVGAAGLASADGADVATFSATGTTLVEGTACGALVEVNVLDESVPDFATGDTID